MSILSSVFQKCQIPVEKALTTVHLAAMEYHDHIREPLDRGVESSLRFSDRLSTEDVVKLHVC